jgi:hypothetical protein
MTHVLTLFSISIYDLALVEIAVVEAVVVGFLSDPYEPRDRFKATFN